MAGSCILFRLDAPPVASKARRNFLTADLRGYLALFLEKLQKPSETGATNQQIALF
jgi:hypothetical protein